MQAEALTTISPLFQAANPRTVEWLMAAAEPHDYPSGRAVLMEDSWGNAVYFIESGWVKVRRLGEGDYVTLAVLGQGDVFGEMSVLDEGAPRSTDVVALAQVKVFSVAAPQFRQALMTDPQMHYRLLQMMVQRIKQSNARFQARNLTSAKRLASTLVELGQKYGKVRGNEVEFFSIPVKDLADISDISRDEAGTLFATMEKRGLLQVDVPAQKFILPKFKQLQHFAGLG
jgi:CRP/FNR family transcriptional regulator, cyclic AMP receptor protein